MGSGQVVVVLHGQRLTHPGCSITSSGDGSTVSSPDEEKRTHWRSGQVEEEVAERMVHECGTRPSPSIPQRCPHCNPHPHNALVERGQQWVTDGRNGQQNRPNYGLRTVTPCSVRVSPERGLTIVRWLAIYMISSSFLFMPIIGVPTGFFLLCSCFVSTEPGEYGGSGSLSLCEPL